MASSLPFLSQKLPLPCNNSLLTSAVMSPGGGTDEKPSHAVGTVGPVVRDAGRRAIGVANGVGRNGHGQLRHRWCRARRSSPSTPARKDTYEATTNAEGYYNIQFVRTGTYEITVSVTGFQTFKATGVEVTSNQVVRTDRGAQGRRPHRIGECRSPGAGPRRPTARRSRRRSASGRSSSCR